jgi:hypothetical protein
MKVRIHYTRWFQVLNVEFEGSIEEYEKSIKNMEIN